MAPTLVVQQGQPPGRIGDVVSPIVHNPRNSMSISQTKGLLNGPGQNNCFLNSAVQVLWHLDIFRRSFRELAGHACMADSCIFCALKELFAQFQYSQESALPPDALRRALAETFFNQQRFQLGFMDDAAECFENILLRIHFHIANAESEDMCNALHCISHQKFAMTLVEQSVCNMCGATSEPLPFTQMVHYVSASAMCTQAKQVWQDRPTVYPEFGQLLRKAGGMGDIRDCPSACGAKIQICRNLMNRPEIVSVGIVWDSERPTLEHIMNVFGTIGTTVRLQDLFHSVVDSRWASTAVHHLVGVVTYYGKHYSTFFFHTKLRVWIYFDDATVREIGPKWEQVVEKCHRGHFQPLLLLYANPHGSPISMATAPQTVTYVAGHKRPEESGPQSQHVSPTAGLHNSLPLKPNAYATAASLAQRRSMTPNPEPGRDVPKEVSPRRAITPNPETGMRSTESQHCVAGPQVPQGMILQGGASQPHVHANDTGYRQRSHSSSSLPSRTDSVTGMQNGSTWPVADNNQPQHQDIVLQQYQGQLTSAADVNNAAYQHVVPLRSKSPMQLPHPHGLVPPPGAPNIPKESDPNHSIYISRKAVENVLNYQKLQRQRSMNNGNYSAVGGNRNSNSSLESFENALKARLQVPSSPGSDSKGSDIPDFGNIPRRRDSGNWSGDRNSASSSSSVSMENPYFYVVGNKRVYNHTGHRHPQVKSVEITANPMYDPGYDSYSLSSNDSFPLSQQAKHNQLLAQIPENPNGRHLHNAGALDDCERLCIEADHYLEKSRDVEDTGDFLGAITLSNSAASKARAAMDAPYTNPQSIMFARMKHNTCVMRTRSLHRRFLMRQESLNSHGSTTSNDTDVGDTLLDTQIEGPHHCRQSSSDSRGRRDGTNNNNSSHSRQSSRDSTGKSIGGHSRQGSRDSRHSLKEGSSHSRQSSRDSQKKKDSTSNIEIYATLPKKSGKKKPEKVKSGSVRVKDEQSIYQSLLALQNSREPAYVETKTVPRPPPEITKDPKPTKEERAKKKEEKKKDKGDTDFSDYASEWELTKKPSLHRTYSSPPSLRELIIPASKAKAAAPPPPLEAAKQPNPGKKQHKIRRKLLMGGLIRRKNRSMPDLREGQDGGIDGRPEGHAFDDLNLSKDDKNNERTLTGYLSDAHLDYVRPGKEQPLRNCPLYGSHRQLSASQLKIPPRPPVRTTSQLSTHYHSQTHLNHAIKTPPPTIPPQAYPSPYQNVPQPRLPQQPLTADAQRIIVQAEVHHERTPSDNVRPVVLSQPAELHAQTVLQPVLRVDSRPQPGRCPHPLPRYIVPPELPVRQTTPPAKTVPTQLPPPPTSAPRTPEPPIECPTPAPPSRLLQELQAKRQQILEKKQQEERRTEQIQTAIPNGSSATQSLPSSPLQASPNGGTWLQELQAKQIQLLQKKNQSPSSQASVQYHSQAVTAEPVQTGKPAPVPNGQACMVPTQATHFSDSSATSRLLKSPLVASTSQPQTDDAGLPARSVRDIASQFEHKQTVAPPASRNNNPAPQEMVPVASQLGSSVLQHDVRNGSVSRSTAPLHTGGDGVAINRHPSFRGSAAPNAPVVNGVPSYREVHQVSHAPEMRNFEHNSTNPQFHPSAQWPVGHGTATVSHDPRYAAMQQPHHSIPNGAQLLDVRYGGSYQQMQNGQYQHYHQNASVPPHLISKEQALQNGGSWHRAMANCQPPTGVIQVDAAQSQSRVYQPVTRGVNGQPIMCYPTHHPNGPNRIQMSQVVQPSIVYHPNGILPEGQYRLANGGFDNSGQFVQRNASQAPQQLTGYNSAPCVRQHDANAVPTSSGLRTPHSTSSLERPDRERIFAMSSELALKDNSKVVSANSVCPPTNGKVEGNTNGVCSLSALSATGSMKKKSKKSVTFSDQIALVASAADEEEPYMPNPLLEKVYKSVVMQQQRPDAVPTAVPHPTSVTSNRTKNGVLNSNTAANHLIPSVNPNSGCCEQTLVPGADVLRPAQSANTTSVPCHLCGKKTVAPPTVYCPDCEFYMSRFKPRTS